MLYDESLWCLKFHALALDNSPVLQPISDRCMSNFEVYAYLIKFTMNKGFAINFIVTFYEVCVLDIREQTVLNVSTISETSYCRLQLQMPAVPKKHSPFPISQFLLLDPFSLILYLLMCKYK